MRPHAEIPQGLQHHRFALQDRTLPQNWKPWLVNLNDSTNEGVRSRSDPEPGKGCLKHADPYDIFLVVLGGTVQLFGEGFGEDSVIFYPKGEEHSLKNVGPKTARILVLEFRDAGHGMSIDEHTVQNIES
jgi:quercetin dioxygenase-like cupin family protein